MRAAITEEVNETEEEPPPEEKSDLTPPKDSKKRGRRIPRKADVSQEDTKEEKKRVFPALFIDTRKPPEENLRGLLFCVFCFTRDHTQQPAKQEHRQDRNSLPRNNFAIITATQSL